MSIANPHITDVAGYRLTERIGSGGMGDVYKAYNPSLNRTAAVKILHQKDMAERFRNEAYIQSSVSHPNIACMYEYVVASDTPCIIMEYVEGESLDHYLHRKGKLSNTEAEQVIGQVASALSYLHKRDIVHRDIKPQNFKIQADGKVTMLDFGIAKAKYTPRLTQQGFAVGTTEYMAPEQFQQQVEKGSDIWSLGVLAYELVTGYLPFEANNPITLRAKIEKGAFTNPKIMVPQVSEKMNLIIERSLRTNPSARITAAQIEKLVGSGEFSGAASAGKLPARGSFNSKKLLIAGAALLFIVVLVLLLNSSGGSQKEKEEKADQSATPAAQKMTIAAPNAPDAYIVFPDGNRQKLPYAISGTEGQNFRFTIEAEGYVPMKVEVPITIRRKSYEYNLEKIEK
ncbi:MAG TPA: serine/threonine-protein kinase [Ferruginibacter sp.]|nr:serine/threonine-protein kinase [Ferruginibacter sp.]